MSMVNIMKTPISHLYGDRFLKYQAINVQQNENDAKTYCTIYWLAYFTVSRQVHTTDLKLQ